MLLLTVCYMLKLCARDGCYSPAPRLPMVRMGLCKQLQQRAQAPVQRNSEASLMPCKQAGNPVQMMCHLLPRRLHGFRCAQLRNAAPL